MNGIESIRLDLGRLLNTVATAETQAGRSAGYGLTPAWSERVARRTTADLQWLCKQIELAVAAYEPRLRNVIVEVQPNTREPSVLRFRLQADVSQGT